GSTRLTSSHLPLSLFLQRPDPHRALHSFPTRRSSDLAARHRPGPGRKPRQPAQVLMHSQGQARDPSNPTGMPATDDEIREKYLRSEEHTSELQSPYDLVCRLLLEKKKKKKQTNKERQQ